MKLRPGMVLAIEPMVNVGTHEVEVLDDDWTAVTLDRKLSAHFEHTVLITDEGPEILTRVVIRVGIRRGIAVGSHRVDRQFQCDDLLPRGQSAIPPRFPKVRSGPFKRGF